MVNNYLILCLKGLHCFFFILLQVVQHVHEMNGGVLMEIAFQMMNAAMEDEIVRMAAMNVVVSYSTLTWTNARL